MISCFCHLQIHYNVIAVNSTEQIDLYYKTVVSLMVESKLTIALWASAYLVQSRSASKYLQSNILQSWGIIFQSELCPNLHHSIKWSRTKSFFVVCRSLSGGAFGVILLTRSGECRNTGLGVISELRPNLKKLILIAL